MGFRRTPVFGISAGLVLCFWLVFWLLILHRLKAALDGVKGANHQFIRLAVHLVGAIFFVIFCLGLIVSSVW
ncbi:hypothetical protein OK016_01620 [Vibrio chagasii]|nr:hypothetical protein [Vibrio chagasii]